MQYGGSGQYSQYQVSTFKTTYGSTWQQICAAGLAPISQSVLGAYGEWVTFKNQFYAWHTGYCSLYYSYYLVQDITANSTGALYKNARSETTSGVWVGPKNLSNRITATEYPQNGATYYGCYRDNG